MQQNPKANLYCRVVQTAERKQYDNGQPLRFVAITVHMKMLILSCATGEGHNSAAKAIKNMLEKCGNTAEIYDVLTFKSARAQKTWTSAYNSMIKFAPTLFGLTYKLGDAYDRLALPSPIYKYNASYAEKLHAYITDNHFDCVVCTHLYAMEAMTGVAAKCGKTVPSYGVLTDYTDIPFYKDTRLDGYFAPTDEVKSRLVKRGIAEDKIFVSGIPVHEKFAVSVSKTDARTVLKLNPDRKIVTILSGGAGCGKISSLCKTLDRQLNDTHDLYVFTGKNARLHRKLTKRFRRNGRITILEFTPEVDRYIKASDVVLSKAGGLSSTEIAVCGVPLVHLKSLPGVESANLKFFAENKLSLYGKSLRKAANCALQLLNDDALSRTLVASQKRTVCATATEKIVSKILGDLTNDNFVLDTADSRRFSIG